MYLDLVFEPDTRNKRGPGGVILYGRLVEVQVPDAIAGLNLVYGTRPVFEQAIRLRLDSMEILTRVAARVVIDLNLKARYDWPPGRIACIEERFIRDTGFERIRKFKCRTREANEDATVMVRGVEDTELEAQCKIAEDFLGVIKKPQSAPPVTYHFTIQMKHASTSRAGKVPFLEGFIRTLEQWAKTGFGLRADDRLRAGQHAAVVNLFPALEDVSFFTRLNGITADFEFCLFF